MVRLHRLMIPVACAGVLLLLVGCGQNIPGSSASSPGLTGTAGTPGNAQPVKTAIVLTRVPPHPSPTTTPSATAPLAGKVTLQLDSAPQRANASIVMTLNNQSSQAILFSDHLTECSVLLLQLEPQPANGGATWQTVAPCRIEIATHLHTLAAGKSLTVTLVPPGGQWMPGLYHALLNYILAGAGQKFGTVSSPNFQIGA